jgi:hypothetical protein
MKHVGIAVILFASLCCAQEAGGFQPSSTNVWEQSIRKLIALGEFRFM